MKFSLPEVKGPPVTLSHFPSRLQAFIFRAYEYIPAKKIAKLLKTTEENIHNAAREMGLPKKDPGDIWLKKGYITIIRRLWHILSYSQLLELLETDEQAFAFLLKEEDFLDIKLGDKPDCPELTWRDLTEEEKRKTEEINKIMQGLSFSGQEPFDFQYQTPKLTFNGAENFETRIIYAFSGLYQRAFDVDSHTFCPDEQLSAYRDLGINGIWTQGVLSQLALFPFEPSLSAGFKKRLERMREFTERLETYGIKLYLYINEPRYMPLDFFDKYPDIKGHIIDDKACLCTSTETVQNYLKSAVEEICRSVPKLGGFFTITRSENLTNCYSHTGKDTNTCPRCKNRTPGEVIGELMGCITEGAHRVKPDIKIFAWSWGWNEANEDIIRHLPKDVILLSQSELDVPFEIGGVKGNVIDYSMGHIGPGERAKREWQTAKKCSLQTGAKVQINTTWEASTVPGIPVSPLIDEHIKGIKDEGVRHLLLSWTLGGYPGANIAAAAKHFYDECSFLPENSQNYEAQKQFSIAFREFPFHIDVLYSGPQNAGPSNLLYGTKSGYEASMTCFAYDDLPNWRGIYPVDVFQNQYEKLCTEWKKGLELLPPDDDSETALMAKACYCLYSSCLNQIRFIRWRDEERFSDAVTAAKAELDCAKEMLSLMNKNAAIGYEAANHYYFSKGQLAEKIINCNYIINRFSEHSSD
ncbi:MAG: hypothetical protein IKL10_08205 [Clostridia bacterium]|nr:hypothetical protein [Clostridia bacterium]